MKNTDKEIPSEERLHKPLRGRKLAFNTRYNYIHKRQDYEADGSDVYNGENVDIEDPDLISQMDADVTTIFISQDPRELKKSTSEELKEYEKARLFNKADELLQSEKSLLTELSHTNGEVEYMEAVSEEDENSKMTENGFHDVGFDEESANQVISGSESDELISQFSEMVESDLITEDTGIASQLFQIADALLNDTSDSTSNRIDECQKQSPIPTTTRTTKTNENKLCEDETPISSFPDTPGTITNVTSPSLSAEPRLRREGSTHVWEQFNWGPTRKRKDLHSDNRENNNTDPSIYTTCELCDNEQLMDSANGLESNQPTNQKPITVNSTDRTDITENTSNETSPKQNEETFLNKLTSIVNDTESISNTISEDSTKLPTGTFGLLRNLSSLKNLTTGFSEELPSETMQILLELSTRSEIITEDISHKLSQSTVTTPMQDVTTLNKDETKRILLDMTAEESMKISSENARYSENYTEFHLNYTSSKSLTKLNQENIDINESFLYDTSTKSFANSPTQSSIALENNTNERAMAENPETELALNIPGETERNISRNLPGIFCGKPFVEDISDSSTKELKGKGNISLNNPSATLRGNITRLSLNELTNRNLESKSERYNSTKMITEKSTASNSEFPNITFNGLEVILKTTKFVKHTERSGIPHFLRVMDENTVYDEDDEVVGITNISKLIYVSGLPDAKNGKLTERNYVSEYTSREEDTRANKLNSTPSLLISSEYSSNPNTPKLSEKDVSLRSSGTTTEKTKQDTSMAAAESSYYNIVGSGSTVTMCELCEREQND